MKNLSSGKAALIVGGLVLLCMFLVLAYGGHMTHGGRTAAMRNACFQNLRVTQSAKEVWMLMNNASSNAAPTWNDLVGQDKPMREIPQCPAGGIYTINAVNVSPTCTVKGHVFEPPEGRR
jgi:hypothetical protein